MSESQINYLTNVLGIEGFIKPEGYQLASEALPHDEPVSLKPQVKWLEVSSASLIFMAPGPVTHEQFLMVKKMSQALGQAGFGLCELFKPYGSLQTLLSATNKNIVIFDEELAEGLGVKNELGHYNSHMGVGVIVTHSLEKLNDSTHAYQMPLKKQTWQHLKLLL